MRPLWTAIIAATVEVCLEFAMNKEKHAESLKLAGAGSSGLYKAGVLVAICIITLALGHVRARTAQQDPTTGQWAIDPTGSPDTVHLTLQSTLGGSGSYSSSFNIPVAELRGLTGAAVAADGAATRFALVREAGVISFEGWFKNQSGSGHFSFSPNPAFVSDMRALGYDSLSSKNLFFMAVHDVNTRFISELNALGYEHPAIDRLIAMRIHGVTIEFITDLKSAGYDQVSIDKLIAMRIHSVSSEFMLELKGLGYVEVSIDNLIAMKIHNVTSGFIRQVAEFGYGQPPVDKLIAMKIHGVSLDFLQSLRSLGYDTVPADQLVSMRIHAVTPEYIEKMKSRGIRDLSVDQLIRLRIQGIE